MSVKYFYFIRMNQLTKELTLHLLFWISIVQGLDERLRKCPLFGGFFSIIQEHSYFTAPSIKLCRRSMASSERNQCLKDSINELMPVIGHGYPSLGLPELDPYQLGEQRFAVSEGIISIKIKIKDSLSLGVSKGHVRSVKSKMTKENFGVILDVMFPYLGGEGNYRGETRLNQLKVQSKGYFKLDVCEYFTHQKC